MDDIAAVLAGGRAWVVLCGDVLEVLRALPEGCVDAVVTDPPYNVGCPYSHYHDRMPPDKYQEWCAAWFSECIRVAVRQVIIFPGYGNFAMWHSIRKPAGVGCWYKPGNPAGAGIFQFCEWEPWLVWGNGRLGLSDTIRVPHVAGLNKDHDSHPCPKPLELLAGVMERLKRSRIILDPFCGSGTTGVACLKTGRRFIGVDISAEYCALARSRLEKAEAEQTGRPLATVTPLALFSEGE